QGAVGIERRHHRGQDRAELGGGGHRRRLFHLSPADLGGLGCPASEWRCRMAEDLMFRPVGELAASVRAGDVSARELVEASYEAIGRLNGELNAFVTLCEERALAEADAVERGDDRPLAGIP